MKARVWVLGIVAGLPLTACRAKGRSEAPGRDVRGWTLAEIEAELQRNDQALASAGIMVAAASVPPVTTAEPAPATEPTGEEAPAEADDAGEGVQPTTPEAYEPAPTAAPPDYADEPLEAEASSYGQGRERQRRASAHRDQAPSRCERVCDLAEATCELETQICELAERHPDEPRYAQACARAEQQCEAAARACDRCED